MTKIFAALVLGVTLLAPVLAQAAPVPAGTVVKAPDWIPGSEWYYSDGYALKVTSVTAKGAVFDRLDAPGQWFSRQGFIREDSASADVTRNAIYRTVPDAAGNSLTAGKPLTFQREYLANGKLLVHASSWTLEGRETITVPAGTFDCWVMVWRTRSLRSDWTGFERWWYSPQIQNYVRVEFKYGPTPPGSRVLMRYHLGPGAAPAPASAAAEPPVPAPVKAVEVAPAPPAVPPAAPIAQPVETAPAPTKAVEAEPPAAPPATANEPPSKERSTPEKDARPPHRRAAKIETPVPNESATPTVKEASGKVGSWHAQVGSSKDAAAMRASLHKIVTGNPGVEALPGGIAVRNIPNRGTFYRAWLGSYDSAKDARALCEKLNTQRPGCAVFKGATVEARAQ